MNEPRREAQGINDGLTSTQARQRLAKDGPNKLQTSNPKSGLRLARDVATEPMFLLLVACGAIYMMLGNKQEALMLLGFFVVVMGISFVQQRRSERSLEALRDLSSPHALVLRDGLPVRIDKQKLVVGYVVLLVEGDRVPADVELAQVKDFAVDESLLTGESVPTSKTNDSRAYSGTLVRAWLGARNCHGDR